MDSVGKGVRVGSNMRESGHRVDLNLGCPCKGKPHGTWLKQLGHLLSMDSATFS